METQAFAREKLHYALNQFEISSISIKMLKKENIVDELNGILAPTNLLGKLKHLSELLKNDRLKKNENSK